MDLFPRIERTCPFLDRLDEALDGDFCRMCQRQVHDLTDMTRAERAAFIASCAGKGRVCVRYTLPVRPAMAAAALAASAAVVVGAESILVDPPPVHAEAPVFLGEMQVPDPPVLAGIIAPPADAHFEKKPHRARHRPARAKRLRWG
ncbi:hypothetical protein [Sphingomonas sp.]|uniref:hypothetical protein n=1 Tax=Sphingomonas sp. TaxID=28214 RepID=UPI001B19069C|nr:hypothetical protein [Sphingomonas sp.]MBO9713149.1 hypothetical protein [Sphingomonas sp.]